MFYYFRHIGIILVVACGIATATYAQVNSDLTSIRRPVPQMFAWTLEDWRADDKPYHDARLKIFAAIKNGQDATVLSRAYKLQFRKSPHDPALVFQYVYASYQASQISPKFKDGGALIDAEQALGYAAPTHTYEFARLHFLVSAENFPRHELKDVGVRLMTHDPSDTAVEWRLVTLFDPGLYPSEKKQALFYAFDLVKRVPNNPDALTRVAATYYDIWLGSEKKSDGEKAIIAYQDYLNRAPQNAAFRKRAQSIIDDIPRIQARWDKMKATKPKQG